MDTEKSRKWQAQEESNPRQRFWRPLYYHYTMGLFVQWLDDYTYCSDVIKGVAFDLLKNMY